MHTHSHDHACAHTVPATGAVAPGVRRALWIALAVNLSFFAIEIGAGLQSGSVSLLADAVDFGGDAASYGLSLAALSMALTWRSRVALLKGVSMGLFGVALLARALWLAWHGEPPQAITMGAVGTAALLANLGVAWLLYSFRNGDANLRSVWLCSRNDALGNLAVMGAALGVFGTGSNWPDLLVAAFMAALAITASAAVLKQARAELDLHG